MGSLGPSVQKILFGPSEHLWQAGVLIINAILPILPSCWGFSFTLGCGVSFFGGIQKKNPKFSCQWLFNSKLQFSSSHRR